MFKILLLIVQLTVWIHADACLTTQGDAGICTPLPNCGSYVNAEILNKCNGSTVEIVEEFANSIEEAYCGKDGIGEQKVCCGPLPHDSDRSFERQYDVIVDPVVASDSYPEPQETCGTDSGSDRILGGTVTELDEFPWMAMLHYLNKSLGELQFGCGGALINRRYVLTAAHCLVDDEDLKLATVRLGEYNTEKEIDCNSDGDCAEPVQEIPVQAYYKHPGYGQIYRNRPDDIGLVRLSRRAKYNEFVQPICLADPDNSNYVPGISTFVSGWGRTSTKKAKYSAVKLKVDLRISNTTVCFSKYRQNCEVFLTEKQLCVGGDEGKDSCRGDSGGPLMRLTPKNVWETIGVTSFGLGCGNRGWPSIYTSVVNYLDWIQEKMIETNVRKRPIFKYIWINNIQ